jgi:1-acyl-sn-glycerol-3-phosphate acyltransferase
LIIAAVRSFVTFVVVSLYLLVVGLPGILVAMLTGAKKHLYVGGHIGVRLGLALSGIRYRVIGADRLPRGRAAVYCANHQSNIDPPVLFTALHPEMHILYKAEINAVPILGRVFRLGGFIPVDRKNREAASRAIEAGADSLRAGNSFLIFPEGTRSPTAELLPFKKGGFVMAIKAGVPIVPVAVSGGRAAMRKGSSVIHPADVTVRIGEPIETAGLTLDQRDEVIAKTRASIQALLEA